MTSETAAYAFRNAFYVMAQTVDANTLVVLGNPALYQRDDVIEIGEVTSEEDFAAYGTNRSREESLDLSVIISVYRGGGIRAEADVFARAYALLELLATKCRITDTTLGGVVRQCFLTSHSYGSGESNQNLAQGRVAVIVAKFTAKARITS